MNLTSIDIKENKDIRKAVKKLYKSAFPKYEQAPWPLLVLLTRKSHSKITAYLDGETFCAFTVSSAINDIIFIMFFAVDDALRGQGYGCEVLSKIKRENPDKNVILNIEPITPDAENLEERIKRLAFYEKNGFSDTGFMAREIGGVFSVLSTNGQVDTESYKKVFKDLSFGLWSAEIKKKEEW